MSAASVSIFASQRRKRLHIADRSARPRSGAPALALEWDPAAAMRTSANLIATSRAAIRGDRTAR